MDSIDTGDQPFNRRPARRFNEPEGVEDTEAHVFSDTGDANLERRRRSAGESDKRRRASEPVEVEDTEGHAVRTYPAVTSDDSLDCRMPLPGDEDERKRRL